MTPPRHAPATGPSDVAPPRPVEDPPNVADYGLRGSGFHDLPLPPLCGTPRSSKEVPATPGMRDDPARADTWGGLSTEARHVEAARIMGIKAARCTSCRRWWCYSEGPDPYVCVGCLDPDNIPPWMKE